MLRDVWPSFDEDDLERRVFLTEERCDNTTADSSADYDVVCGFGHFDLVILECEREGFVLVQGRELWTVDARGNLFRELQNSKEMI